MPHHRLTDHSWPKSSTPGSVGLTGRASMTFAGSGKSKFKYPKFIVSGKRRGNTIGTIVRRIIIRWWDRNIIHRQDRQFDEPKRRCCVIDRIRWRRLRRHRDALLFGRADNERVLTGRQFGGRMLSLASTSQRAVQIGKMPAQIAKFRGDALRSALRASA